MKFDPIGVLILMALVLFLASCENSPPCKEGHTYKHSCIIGKSISQCEGFQCDVFEDCTQWRTLPEDHALQCLRYRSGGKNDGKNE